MHSVKLFQIGWVSMYSDIPGVWEEKPGSRTIKMLRNGAQGHMEYYAYTMADALYYCPKPGESHPLWTSLTVDTVDIVGVDVTATTRYGEPVYDQYIVSVEYTLDYKKMRPGDSPRVTYDIGVELLNTSEGKTWLSTNRKAGPEINQSIPFPLMPFTVSFSCYAEQLPTVGIFNTLGKINLDQFVVTSSDTGITLIDVAPESTLFEGANITAQYDFELQNWYFNVDMKFTWRPFSQNIVWRTPDYKKDRFGNILYYQSDDPSGDNYTTDDTLLNLPVPRADASGIAGWDEFKEHNYETADFGALII